MGGVQPKCCATQEVQNTTGEAASETKLLGDQPIPPAGKPLWLAEAEEYVAMQKQKEEEQARRIQQLAAERAEEEKKEKELEEKKKSEEEAKGKEKKKASTAKKPPAKMPTPKLDEQVKQVSAPTLGSAPAGETAKAPDAAAEQQQKIDDALKAVKESGDMKFEFEVKCVSARGLRDADWLEGTSDPYCLCEAVGKVKSKFKTKTVSNKENPVWNQAAKMQLCHGDKLKFSIFDQDTGKADDFLGYAELNFEQLSSGYEGELCLKDASDTAAKVEAYIKVRVRNLGAVVPK